MSNPHDIGMLHPDEKGFGALVERVTNMQNAVEALTRQTSVLTKAIEQVGSEAKRTQWEVEALAEKLAATELSLRQQAQQTERELRAEIERNSVKKLWGNLTSFLAAATSLLALLVALGVIKGAP
jgi:regulator of replication initiation timing